MAPTQNAIQTALGAQPPQAFFWGSNGQRLSPEQIRSRRAIADALLASTGAPKTLGEGLDYFGKALSSTIQNHRLDEMERSGNAEASSLISDLIGNQERGTGDILSAASNDYVAGNPRYAAIIDALMSEERQQAEWARQDADPLRQLQIQAAQQGLDKGALELDQLRNPPAPEPDWQTITDPITGDVFRWNANDPASTPQLFYDATEPPPDDGMTDTQRNLSWRAKQAGLVPGTPEYAEFMRSGGQSTGMALSVGSDGTVQFSQGGGKLTEANSKDTVYATRASGALPEIDRLEQSLLSFGEYAAGAIPMGLGNYLQSEDYQVANNAGKEFLASILRKDTGAAVTPSEEKLYGDIFLPRPGDKPATLARKRQARALALEAIKAGMPPQAIENMARALSNAGVEGSAAPGAPPLGQSQANPAIFGGNPNDPLGLR